jgi:glycerophosphoryl diester phosphodiesterase
VTESSFSQGSGPAVVAHRGASSIEAENTIPAFELAIAAGADAVEFDVRITADGHPVVLHDADVARTTDGRGLVRDLSLGELKALRIHTADGGFTEIPTLEDALACCSGRVAVDVELKNVPGDPDFEPDRERAAELVVEALGETGFVGPVLISSFNPFAIARVRAIAHGIPTGLLTDTDVDAAAALSFVTREGHPWVLPFVRQVRAGGRSLVEDAHAAGVMIGTWITDDPDEAAALAEMGVDAIATNDPARLVPVIRGAR